MYIEPNSPQCEKILETLREIEAHLRIISLRSEQKEIKERSLNLLNLVAGLQNEIVPPSMAGEAFRRAPSSLFGLVYISHSLVPDAEIAEICDKIFSKAVVRNHQLGLTGYLIYSSGYFVQYLEGPRENLEYLYGRIVLNPAHDNTRVLFNDSISSRCFDTWSMGYAIANPAEESKLKEFIQSKLLDHSGRLTLAEMLGLMHFIDVFSLQQ